MLGCLGALVLLAAGTCSTGYVYVFQEHDGVATVTSFDWTLKVTIAGVGSSTRQLVSSQDSPLALPALAPGERIVALSLAGNVVFDVDGRPCRRAVLLDDAAGPERLESHLAAARRLSVGSKLPCLWSRAPTRSPPRMRLVDENGTWSELNELLDERC